MNAFSCWAITCLKFESGPFVLIDGGGNNAALLGVFEPKVWGIWSMWAETKWGCVAQLEST